MSVKLRLTRMGRKKRPYYRIVATDSRTRRDGKYIEKIGTYDPLAESAQVEIDKELALKWLENGATPSNTVRNFLRKEGILFEHDLRKRGLSPEEIEVEYKKWDVIKQERQKKAEAMAAMKIREEEKKAEAEAKAKAKEEEAKAKEEEAAAAKAAEEAAKASEEAEATEEAVEATEEKTAEESAETTEEKAVEETAEATEETPDVTEEADAETPVEEETKKEAE